MSQFDQYLFSALSKYWGYSEFKEHQLDICRTILNKKDSLVIMSTGSGKSLTFQLPALALKESGMKCCTLIISPLISLMDDQVSFLLSRGVSACVLGSNSTQEIERKAMKGEFSLVYSSPEKISSWSIGLREMKKNIKIICCAIDESHCIYDWKNGFRPEYGQLGKIRDLLDPDTPFLALTATATKKVQKEIVDNLGLRDPHLFKSSTDRPNLKFIVKNSSSSNDVLRVLISYRQEQIKGSSDPNQNIFSCSLPYLPTIIYVPTKAKTLLISNEIVKSNHFPGVKVAYYNSTMSSKERSTILEAFLKNDIEIIVATNAFGMGINKLDLRLVIHFGLPLSIEAYYQQVGRAGRDNLPADCVLIWARKDISDCYTLIQENSTIDSNDQIEKMVEYAQSNYACRRKFLLNYFDENEHNTVIEGSFNCCDLCDIKYFQLDQQEKFPIENPNLPTNRNDDFSYEVYMMVTTIFELHESHGVLLPISLLLGKNDQRTQKVLFRHNYSFFGQGSIHSEEWWKALLYLLTEQEHLIEQEIIFHSSRKFSYKKYSISRKGKAYLFGCKIEDLLNISNRKNFDFNLHFYRFTFTKEFENANNIENREKSSIHQVVEFQHYDFLKNQSSNSAVDFIEVEKNSFINKARDAREVEEKIRNLRDEFSRDHRLNPSQILSSKEITTLVDVFAKSVSEIMNLFQWEPWKILLAERLFEILKNKEDTFVDASISIPQIKAESISQFQQNNNQINTITSVFVRKPALYRPNYSNDNIENQLFELDHTSNSEMEWLKFDDQTEMKEETEGQEGDSILDFLGCSKVSEVEEIQSYQNFEKCEDIPEENRNLPNEDKINSRAASLAFKKKRTLSGIAGKGV